MDIQALLEVIVLLIGLIPEGCSASVSVTSMQASQLCDGEHTGVTGCLGSQEDPVGEGGSRTNAPWP